MNPAVRNNVVAQQDAEFRVMGEQLTAQYRVAVGGMVEILKFGTMLMHIRNVLLVEGANKDGGVKLSTLDSFTTGGPGRGHKMGLSHWLREYAPEISRSTAYRFMGIAEAVAGDYAEVVGSRMSKQVSFVELVTAAPESLPETVRAKQLELFDYVSGTSQRSWLDQFKAEDDTPRGGPREGAGRPIKDDALDAESARCAWILYMEKTAELLNKWNGKGFIHMDKEQIAALYGLLDEVQSKIKRVLGTQED